MNLVNVIKDQFSSQLTSKLSELVGGSEQQTSSALGAIIPALLAAFSKMSSGGDGSKLADAFNQFDADSLGKITDMFSQKPEQALDQGNDLLGSLFGSGTLSGLVGALSKFTGSDAGGLKKLLAYVSPLVMGTIAKQFQGKPATAQGLQSLFDDQQDNIAAAMPAGLSLASVPGISDVAESANAVASSARQAATAADQTGSSAMKTLLPLGALALLALLGWNFLNRGGDDAADQQLAQADQPHTVQKPVTDSDTSNPGTTNTTVPDAALPAVETFNQDLQKFYSSATEALSDITDVESAEAAVPRLTELGQQVDTLQSMQQKLPEAARGMVAQVAGENLGKLTELIEKVTAIPGVGEKLKPILDPIVAKLKTFSGEPAAVQTP